MKRADVDDEVYGPVLTTDQMQYKSQEERAYRSALAGKMLVIDSDDEESVADLREMIDRYTEELKRDQPNIARDAARSYVKSLHKRVMFDRLTRR